MSRHQPRRARFGTDYTLRPNVVRRAVDFLYMTEHRARVAGNRLALYPTEED